MISSVTFQNMSNGDSSLYCSGYPRSSDKHKKLRCNDIELTFWLRTMNDSSNALEDESRGRRRDEDGVSFPLLSLLDGARDVWVICGRLGSFPSSLSLAILLCKSFPAAEWWSYSLRNVFFACDFTTNEIPSSSRDMSLHVRPWPGQRMP